MVNWKQKYKNQKVKLEWSEWLHYLRFQSKEDSEQNEVLTQLLY